ncbi:MAG: exosome complex exonuclease Rrp41 [Methanophagales archaeon]|nr:exosome complex exonuclease Rrp41 [Methanophagales archaeon]MCW3138688.1 exosome complex exonuclease Rrp41 [Methanophagales archaeon]MCW3139716.1 exosome complex exonuclease Rrp41 [Methanophagales archaeon]MCW7069167.1 exosome complex exonuclease Rrp41 [Methanophagales archaeon]MCW7072308.1 exosome complex exonuclease Rrp41 [Methanophagales archaeon]
MKEEGIELIKDGKRLDGRGFDELRPIKIEVGVLKRADGSCYFELGDNKVIAAVYGPREMHPRHAQDAKMAVLKYRYNMAPFSVDERKRPGPDRRSVEISKVSREALEPVIIREFYPKTEIDVYVEILQSDAGTRTAGINAASIALADAGIPMKDLVSSVAVGKIDGEVVLDLNAVEDNYGEADMPIAMIARRNTITALQMDGRMTKDEFEKGLKLAMNACQQIYELQRTALIERYSEM